MTKQRDREEFISIMVGEGMPLDHCREILRLGARLHREAELQCSDEATDRDRVPCPAADAAHAPDCIRRMSRAAECSCFKTNGPCPCRDAGSFDADTGDHGDVPRSHIRELRAQQRIAALCAPYGIKPDFQGDPRGAVVKLKVPSGRTNDWGRTGICVP